MGDFFQLSNKLYGDQDKHCFMLAWFNDFFSPLNYYTIDTSFSSGTELKEGNILVRCVVEDNLHQNVVLPVRSPRFCTNTVNAIETDILCNKCRHKCRNILRRKQILDINDEEDAKDSTFSSPKRSKCIQVHVSSPPSIALLLLSSSRSHSYFFCLQKTLPKASVSK